MVSQNNQEQQIQVANQQKCDYSVRINYDTFKCMTSQEYKTFKVQEYKHSSGETATVIIGSILLVIKNK